MPAPELATVENLKVPPHSLEAEQAVLGGLLLSPRAWDTVADIVTEPDFYREDHRMIFRAIAQLSNASKPCDAVTVTEWFESHGLVDQVDGGGYIIQLASSTPLPANVRAYAEIVREKSILRQLIDVGSEITAGAFALEGRSSKELLEEAERLVFAIADQGQRSGSSYVSVQSALNEAIERIQELHEHEGEITGIPTGYKDFDKMTAGLQDSDLVIVAGRPAMGKTTFAMNIAEHAAIKSQKAVAVFSMEMSAVQLVMRPDLDFRGFAGTIEAVGQAVQDWKPGDEVFGNCTGAFAEYALASASELVARPAGLDFESTSALGVSAQTALQAIKDLKGDNHDQEVGVTIACRAMQEPLRQIVANAGGDPSVVLNAVAEGKGDFGYNAATGKYGDMIKEGILDPTKVTRFALQNAASVSGLLLTTEAMVADAPKDEAPAMPDMGGMGGMGGMM